MKSHRASTKRTAFLSTVISLVKRIPGAIKALVNIPISLLSKALSAARSIAQSFRSRFEHFFEAPTLEKLKYLLAQVMDAIDSHLLWAAALIPTLLVGYLTQSRYIETELAVTKGWAYSALERYHKEKKDWGEADYGETSAAYSAVAELENQIKSLKWVIEG